MSFIDPSRRPGAANTPCGNHCLVCHCHLRNLGNLLEVGRALWPAPQYLPAEAQEALDKLFEESLSNEPLIPGMK